METLQPKMRFPEFEGNWENKLFKETCQVNPSNKKLPTEFIYIDLESVNDGLLSKENEILLDEAPSRAQRLLAKEDVLFQMVRPYQKNNFYFDKDGDYVASTGYAQLRANASSKFLFQYLHNQKFVDKVIEKCTGSNYPAINSTDLANIIVVFPKKEEQTRIANFLSSVDEKLNLLKEKKSLLEDYKKGIMQKIFNQEIRLKDDNGNDFEDWEEKQIKDIFKVTRGTVLSMLKVKADIEDDFLYPVYSSQTKQKGLAGYYNSYLFENAITWTTDGAGAGDVKYRKGKFYCTNVCGVLLNDEGYCNLFIAEILNSISRNYVSYVGNPKLMNNVMSEISIFIPKSIKEQTKIANFLSAIDEKIELVSNQIQDTQEYKKGLLQQMFV